MEWDKMNKSIIYLILLTYSISRFAIAETDPHFENKGYTLTQDSWVFSPDKAKSVRDRLIDLETTSKINESLNKSLELYKSNEQLQQNKINLLLEQNDKLAVRLNDSQSLNNWEKFGLFVLGIVATVGAGFAIKKAGQ